MRSDIDHLPSTKQRELERVVAILFEEFEEARGLSTQEWKKKGRILKVVPSKTGKVRLVIEGVNLIKRHTKPNPGKNVKGGIVERDASLHASNVQLVCPECGAQTRIGHKILGDGRKVRICRKCEGVVDK